MSYIGDLRLGKTFDTSFTTVGTSGAPTQLAGSPVISAYVGSSTTQITAGITLTVDFDGVTGYNHITVVATSGNGYATASNYRLVITTGTVGGTSVVGYVVGEFSIEARSALMPTTVDLTLDVSATGEAGIDWANVGGKTTVNALTNTSIITTQQVDVNTIKTNPVVNAGTVTFPTTATLASTTNITAGTITTATTATNLTNAPTNGDFTAVMKTSIGTAVAASAVASVTGNVGGNVTGSVGSVVGAVGSVNGAVGSVTGNVGGNVVGSTASVTGAVGSVTGNVGGNLLGTLSTTERNAISDAMLDRNMATGTDSGTTTIRTMRQALRFLRNKWSISGGTLTVLKEDDATSSWTGTVTQTAGNPVSSIDPAG